MSTATTTSHNTGQHTTTQSTNTPTTQLERSAAQNVVPMAVTAGDKIEGLCQLASGRCLSADRAGVYSRSEVGGGRVVRAE